MTNRKEKIDEYANKLKEWDERIIDAEKNLAELAGDMKESAEKEIENLKAQIKEMKEKLNKGDSKTDNFIDDFNKGFEKNWIQLQETIKSIHSPLH